MQTRYKSEIVPCSFCGEKIFRRNFQRHWLDDCARLPAVPEDHGICTVCHSIKPIPDFPGSRTHSKGYSATCKACTIARYREWQGRAKSEGIWNGGNSRTPGFKKRPGAWVLKPCEWCSELFRHYDMILHRRRCPKRPPRTDGRKHNFVPAYHVPPSEIETAEEAKKRLYRNSKNVNLRRYGISIHDFDLMLATQGGVCAICGNPPGGEEVPKNKRVLHVDHDHVSGATRGLLCYTCNHGIGNFLEDPMNLAKAILYLRRFKEFDMWQVVHYLQYENQLLLEKTKP